MAWTRVPKHHINDGQFGPRLKPDFERQCKKEMRDFEFYQIGSIWYIGGTDEDIVFFIMKYS